MASTIKTTVLEFGPISTPVSLRGASEKKDVSLGRALPVKNKKGEVTGYRPLCRIDVPEPEEDAENILVEPIRRNNGKGKVDQAQYDEEIVQGVWEGDDFHPITPEEIEAITERTTLQTLEVQETVPLAEIPWERAQASYYLAPPQGIGAKNLVMIRDALAATGLAGVAKLMPKSRQKLAIIYPKHGGLMVTVLAYADTFAQVVEGASAISTASEPNPKIQGMVEKLAKAMAAPADALDEYRDDLIDLKADLIERVKLGEPVTESEEPEKAPEPAPSPGADRLMEELRASVKELGKAKHKPSRKTPTSKRRRAAAKS